MATATMTASPQASESSYVTADMWSIFEESGLDDLASSFIRPHSSPIRPSHFSSSSASASISASPSTLRSSSSLLGSMDDNAASNSSSSPLSADFLVSPLRPSPFAASPSGYLRPPASRLSPFLPPSPLLGNYDHHPLHNSPSLRIMKQFQSNIPASSLSSLSPSPSHRSSFSPFRSPLLPSAYLGTFASSYRQPYHHHAGSKSAFDPQLYTSPVVKQERAGMSPSSSPSVLRIPLSLGSATVLASPLVGGRLDGLQSIEEDDITASSFPSLPSLSSMSSGGSSAFSSIRSEGMELADERAKSEFASSSLSALGDSAASSLKRGRPSMPASPPSRNKRLKRSESTSSTSSNSPTPPPASSSPSLKPSDPATTQQRQQKGLRHFSLKVCEKVEQQGVTTYNNVADELVADLANEPFDEDADADDADGGGGGGKKRGKRVAYDEKNVRRRVYDALNVLTAMGIIVKEKKKITWIGLPGGVSQTVGKLADEKKARDQRLKEKRNHLQELLVYVVALKNLKQRNIAAANASSAASTTATNTSTAPATTAASSASTTPAASASTATTTAASDALSLQHDHIPLRFVLIKTDASHIVHLSVSPDQTELHCDVSGAFLLHDESEVLKGMGLANIDGFDLPYLIPREICSFYPERYVRRSGGSGANGGAEGKVDEAVGGRIGPGTVSLGGLKRK